MSTRIRWLACGVLAIAIATLAFSFRGSGPRPSAASNASGSTIAQPTNAPPTSTPLPSTTLSTQSLHTPKVGDLAPVRPDAARGLTIAAAEALGRYFLAEAHNHLKATGDGRSVSEVSHPTCSPCSGDVEGFSELNTANRRLSGDRSVVVEVKARQGKHRAVMKPGAPVSNFSGGPAALVVTLVAMNGDWSVFDVEAR